jgi:transposase
LGLTPKEDSSALRRRLGAISKQGDVYLRMLLTHGARSFLWHAKATAPPTILQHWAVHTEQRRGHNVATVAVANKLARIIWAVWPPQRPFVAAHRPV